VQVGDFEGTCHVRNTIHSGAGAGRPGEPRPPPGAGPAGHRDHAASPCLRPG